MPTLILLDKSLSMGRQVSWPGLVVPPGGNIPTRFSLALETAATIINHLEVRVEKMNECNCFQPYADLFTLSLHPVTFCVLRNASTHSTKTSPCLFLSTTIFPSSLYLLSHNESLFQVAQQCVQRVGPHRIAARVFTSAC